MNEQNIQKIILHSFITFKSKLFFILLILDFI